MIGSIVRPAPSEYPRYYRTYTGLVPDGDILELLTRQMTETQFLLATVPQHLEEHRYAADKWSVREVVGHCIDTERVFAFRMLWFARGASGGQPSMDQDEWAATSNAGSRTLSALGSEWSGLRRDVVSLLASLDEDALARAGIASRRKFTARSFPWIIAGHELHHVAILRTRYGLGSN
jgi:hypothetical protein